MLTKKHRRFYCYLSAFVILLPALSCKSTKEVMSENPAAFELKYEKFTLSNGLEVVLHKDPSDPIVAVATIMHVGSSREKPGKTGFAHFFEHMAFNDSENAPVGSNRKLIPEWGGQRNGGTWTDGTQYYEVVPKDAFDKILWIDSDRLGYMIKTVTEEALAREIQVVKNEKRQNVDNTAYGFTDEIIRKNLYPSNHPYSWTVIGSLPDLQAATLADVQEFYHQYYGAANATLVIAGDIDIAETKAKVERWFGEIPRGPEVRPMGPMPVTLTETKSVYFEDNFAKLPELRMTFPVVENYHPDSYALQVLGQLLSGSRSTPLYKGIVEEKKLAPSVSTYYNGSELAGQFVFRVRGNANVSLNEIRQAITEGLTRFETEQFSETDLQRIRAVLETELYQGISTVLNKALQMGVDNEFKGDPAFTTKAAKMLSAVTKEDVMRVYHKYIKNQHHVMTSVIPKGQKDLAAEGAKQAEVWQEKVEAISENEQVSQGEEAKFEKTITKHDRSEPPFSELPLFKMPDIWKASLDNGLKIYGIYDKELPLVSFDITIPGGHYADPISKPGVAYLTAQMMMQGTATKTPAQLEEALELLGASANVSSTQEEIRVYGSCLSRNYQPTLELMQEVLLEPRWDVTEFNRLKKALETALKGQEANAPAVASKNFMKLLYGDKHILGYPVPGTLESISNITLDDLKEYYSKYVSPSTAAFHLAGAVDQSAVTASLQQLESKWQAKGSAIVTYPLPAPDKAGNVYFIDIPGAKQSVIYVGKLALSAADAASNKLNVVNDKLGRGSSSLLFQTLRIEKGFTYGASSNVQRLKEVAPFTISTSVRANATKASLEIIRDMVRDYGRNYNEADMAVSKNKILKSITLAYEQLDDKRSILHAISKFNKSDKYLEEEQQEMLAMTLADFKATIEKYMSEKDMIYVIVGDKETQFKDVSDFAGGKVIELD